MIKKQSLSERLQSPLKVAVFLLICFALPTSGRADEKKSDDHLLFNRELINRYSLDHLPRSISIRQSPGIWIGYDLERAKVYKVWKLPKEASVLKANSFRTKSSGTPLFVDKTNDVWQLRDDNKTVPLQARYLGCAQKKDYFELTWELKQGKDAFKLIERISILTSGKSGPVIRKLRIESLGENQAVIPPKSVQKEWKIVSDKGEEKAGLSGGKWHQLILR